MTKIIATPHIKKEVVDHHLGFRTRGVLDEKYEVKWLHPKDKCKTGCWRFDVASDKHIISVSPLAYDTLATDRTKRVQVPELFRHVYEHEAAHSKYTTKDLPALAAKLHVEKIPWRLQNLFEDCRIERLWQFRERRRRSWKWTLWDKHPTGGDIAKVSAQCLLYRMKCESVKRSLPRDFYSEFCVLPFYDKVLKYYRRILACRTTEDLIPVLKDWLTDFPHSGDDTIEEEGGLGTGDLAGAIADAVGKAPSDVKSKDPKGEGASVDTRGGSTEVPTHEASEIGGDGSKSSPFDGEAVPTNAEEKEEFLLAHRLAGMLDTAFRAKGDGRETTSNPSKKLNVKGILRGDFLRPYIGKAVSDRGKPHISMIVDCSGSMAVDAYVDRERKKGTRADTAGRILLRALNVLAKRGRITGVAYASEAGGVSYRVVLPSKDHLAFKRFNARSSNEGIGTALNPSGRPHESKGLKGGSVFNEIVSKSKMCIVYTDGDITDEKIDRAPLRARGLYTLGVCCSAYDRTNTMKEHFDGYISRESLWGLADAVVRHLKSLPVR